MSLARFFKRTRTSRSLRQLEQINQRLDRLQRILIHSAMFNLETALAQDPRYADPKRLLRHGSKTFSQNGEDGIIAEIFHRISASSRKFVEIGVGNGLENNTALLLAQGWSGWWVEGGSRNLEQVKLNLRAPIRSGQLAVSPATVTAENAPGLLAGLGVPAEFDLLSIDIDRNTYWIWAALDGLRPRAAVIEYNSIYPPSMDWKVEYRPDLSWNGTAYFGASLKALELLGRKLGYALVGCDLTGVNAFFVRDDLCAGKFAEPFTAENHYEPPRYRMMVQMNPCFSDVP